MSLYLCHYLVSISLALVLADPPSLCLHLCSLRHCLLVAPIYVHINTQSITKHVVQQAPSPHPHNLQAMTEIALNGSESRRVDTIESFSDSCIDHNHATDNNQLLSPNSLARLPLRLNLTRPLSCRSSSIGDSRIGFKLGQLSPNSSSVSTCAGSYASQRACERLAAPRYCATR